MSDQTEIIQRNTYQSPTGQHPNNRRDFLKTLGIGSLGLMAVGTPLAGCHKKEAYLPNNPLLNLNYQLLTEWCDALLQHQFNDPKKPGLHGGILCPACARIHGRCADAVYPLLYMAKATGNPKYTESAQLLFNWMDTNVSLPDGSWANDVNVSDWNGTTVFAVISLGEALLKHGDLLAENVKKAWLARLKTATEFIYKTFDIEYSNINYPINGAYAMLLMGELFQEKKYTEHGRKLAHESLRFITPKDKLLFGEGGGDKYTPGIKGSLPVDLGYNVEESLPALVLYGLKANDEEVLSKVKESLDAHLEFMLPDGGWDNSWGTRSFKWTYWGSRTSDGSQPAFALLANRVPSFYQAALKNTLLLKKCTSNGLLYGGPHQYAHGILPCIHHTFCHSKALATVLDHGLPEGINMNTEAKLPRDKNYGIKEFQDIQTWLVSNENWVGTVTAYDREYKFKNGHPTGGALSMLYHRKLGPILASGMNKYQMIEGTNMQTQTDPFSINLTPRLETEDGNYTNISDLGATMQQETADGKITVRVHASLVNGEQKHPESGRISCLIRYTFTNEGVEIECTHDAGDKNPVRFILPVISPSDEPFILSDNSLSIKKSEGKLIVSANQQIQLLPTSPEKNRIFNFVPGMEALPVYMEGDQLLITIKTS